MDSVTQYELWQGLWHGIADLNLFELAHAIERHNGLLGTFVPSTFVGNHDVSRIASSVADRRHLPHALAVLFTVAGVPAVYAGDEYGWEAVKEERLGGDDAVRPPFPPVPLDLDAQDRDTREIYQAHASLIALRRQQPWLHRAHTDVTHLTNTAIVLRTATSTATVATALNLGDAEVTLPIADATLVQVGAGAVSDGQLRLPPHGWAVLGL